MNHVTFETALVLKAAGFPQPTTYVGCSGYDISGKGRLLFIHEAYGHRVGYVRVGDPGAAITSIEKVDETFIFAPTATDIIKELGRDFSLSYMNGEWFVLKSTGDFLPISSEPSVWKHIISAEAAAMAWLALNKKI